MFKKYFIAAWRSLKRDKWYSLLNVLGLTTGISFSIFLVLYVIDELSYDRYNQHADDLFRVVTYAKEPAKDVMKWSSTQPPLAPELKREFPEVEEAVRFIDNGRTVFEKGNTNFYETKVFVTDSNVFKVFTFPFIEGNPATALKEPYSIVLTESIAEKYFGKTNGVLGQNIEDADGEVFKVTGVMKDVPRNSHFIFDMLISESTLPKNFADSWGGFFIFTYVLLKPGTEAHVFEKKLQNVIDKFVHPQNMKLAYKLQPVTSIHLHSDMMYEPEEVGSITYVYILSAVAMVMLIIACINYMNLTTARSAKRAKEIGIRKVSGATKASLVVQFLTESVLSAVIAVLLSMGLLMLLLPVFNQLSGKSFSIGTLLQPQILVILTSMVLFVGFASGSYPAFYLSKFNPIYVLKSSLAKSSGNIVLRRVLITIQFSISIVMLICTIVIYKQLQYIRSKDLGFSQQMVVSIPVNKDDALQKVNAFKNEMRKSTTVLSVSSSSAVPGNPVSLNVFSVQTPQGYVQKSIENYKIDENYIKTLGMHIAEGRDFMGLTDTNHSVIVNENLVKYCGWKNPVGQRIMIPGDSTDFFEVVGVVKDFNQKALYNPVGPIMLFYKANSNGIQLKLNGANIPGALAVIEKTWKAIFPDLPFEYKFLDQQYNSQYVADQRRGKIFTYFSAITILINCLGLLGLIAYTTEQRQKEISIRKVLGAGLSEIVPLITRHFVFLIGLSCIIAFPVSWFFMNRWLGTFYYSTQLTVLPFLLAACTVLIITLLTVIYHTVRAALSNPVRSLRSE